MNIQDATLITYDFFIQKYSREGKEDADRHWDRFAACLKDGLGWVGDSKTLFDRPTLNRKITKRIASASRITSRAGSKYEKTLEARTLQDAYYLQSGIMLFGQGDISKFVDFAYLRLPVPEISLGRAQILTAEYNVADIGDKSFATESLKVFGMFDVKAEETILVSLPFGCLALPQADIDRDLWILWIDKDKPMKPGVVDFVHRLAPPVLLSRRKWFNQMARYEEKVLLGGDRLERELERLNDAISRSGLKLSALEGYLESSAQVHKELSEIISRAEEVVLNLEINIKIIDSLVRRHCGAAVADPLRGYWADPIALDIAQVNADLKKFCITRNQTNQIIAASNAIAGVRVNRSTRHLGYFLGALTAFGVAQVFSDFFKSPWSRILFSASLFALVVAILLMIGKRADRPPASNADDKYSVPHRASGD